jgi:hypothetical protein
MPWLFCDDSWLVQFTRTDFCFEKGTLASQQQYLTTEIDGVKKPVPVQDVDLYFGYLYTVDEKGVTQPSALVPYWSDDLMQYIFDTTFGGNTYCTAADTHYGVTQDQTIPGTITLCRAAFSNQGNSVYLGSWNPIGKIIAHALPRSSTFFYELFHLVLSSRDTPDYVYK